MPVIKTSIKIACTKEWPTYDYVLLIRGLAHDIPPHLVHTRTQCKNWLVASFFPSLSPFRSLLPHLCCLFFCMRLFNRANVLSFVQSFIHSARPVLNKLS